MNPLIILLLLVLIHIGSAADESIFSLNTSYDTSACQVVTVVTYRGGIGLHVYTDYGPIELYGQDRNGTTRTAGNITAVVTSNTGDAAMVFEIYAAKHSINATENITLQDNGTGAKRNFLINTTAELGMS